MVPPTAINQGVIHQKPLNRIATPLRYTGYCSLIERVARRGETTITGVSCKDAPIIVIVSHPSVAIWTSTSTCGNPGDWIASGAISGNNKPKRADAQAPVSKKGSGIASDVP